MEKNNNEVTNNVIEAGDQAPEKKSVFKRIGEAAGNFKQNHPKIASGVSTVIKVGAGVGIGVLATVIRGRAKNSSADGELEFVDLDEIEPFDDDVVEAIYRTGNDDNN